MKQFLIFILLIIFVIGITQSVQAQNAISGTVVTHDFRPNGNLNSQATCASLVDGSWNENTKTCTIPDNRRVLTIGDRQTLVIDTGYTLVVSNSGATSTGIYLASSISGGGKIINNGIIIISNSGEYSEGIEIGKPSSLTNNGLILITNSGAGSSGIFTADYVGCSHAIQAYTGGCATSLTNNGDIIISNTNPSTSSKWYMSNGIYGGKIIDKGTIRVMSKEDAYKELAKKKIDDTKTLDGKKVSDVKKPYDVKKAEKIKLAKERAVARKAVKPVNIDRCANFSQKDLSGCDLHGMDLNHAHFDDMNLSGANLVGTSFFLADLRHANLSGADLTNADLRYANLSGANLSDADLSGANLDNANLVGTIAPDHRRLNP